jgi:hypothetical protein
MTRDKAFHTAYGRHSNIPDCCIRFFVEEWDGKELWRRQDIPIVRMIRRARAGYVLCPACLQSNHVVKIRQCRKECGKECVNEFWDRRELEYVS